MLADAAQVQGGKLFILGGGFDTISVRTLPIVHKSITLAMVAEIEPDERHRDLEISISLEDEDGQAMDVEASGSIRVGDQSDLPSGATSIVPIVSPFHNIEFAEAKGYAFVVELEGEELARVRFRVVRVT